MDTAIAVGLGWPSYSVGWLAPAITKAPSMESWGLRLEEQFGPTSATVDTWADLVSSRKLVRPSGENVLGFCLVLSSTADNNVVIHVYDEANNMIETHEHAGEFKQP